MLVAGQVDRLGGAEVVGDVLFELLLRDREAEISDDDAKFAALIENRLLLLGLLCGYRAA